MSDELTLARQEAAALRAKLKLVRERLATAERENELLRLGAIAIVAKVGEGVAP